ncbi:MAG TPA: serine hydrolase domain-containing protein [Allosphingosinicella sp.]
MLAGLTLAGLLFAASTGSNNSSVATGGLPASSLKASILSSIANIGKEPSVVDYGRLDQRLTALSQEKAVVGLAVAVVENGQVRFMKGYGETIAGSGDPVTTDTVFRWASVSKGVAGDMVAKLAAEGKLSLYEPAGKYAPSLRLPGGNEARATISDILSHRLGIYAHAYEGKLEDGMDARLLRSSLSALNNICAPGQCHAYQNVAYDAASEIVETVTGKPYPEAVRQQLFLPLGMTSATATREGLLGAKSWARPHRGGKDSKPVEVTDSYYRVPAAGGVNSSIKDLAIWMIAQMGAAPDVLPKEALESVQTPVTGTPGELGRLKAQGRIKDPRYGLGWRIYDYAGHTIIGHRGGVTGYRSLILFDPKKKSGVVALWNSATNQPSGLEFEVMDMLYGLEPIDWLKLDSKPSPLAGEG